MHPVVHHVKRRAATHFEEKYRKPHGHHAHLILTIDSVLVAIVLGLLALGSYFAFVYDPLRDDFRIGIEGAEELRGGRTATLFVTFTNESDETLTDIEAVIIPPAGFLVASTLAEHDQVEIGALPKGGSMRFSLMGAAIGAPGTHPLIVRVRATGRESGETDEKLVSFPLEWTERAVSLEWTAPTTAVAGEETAFTLTLANASDLEFENVAVRPEWPAGFELRLASPPLRNGELSVPLLGRDDAAVFEFVGVFAGPEGSEREVSATAAWKARGRSVALADASAKASLYETGFRLSAEIVTEDHGVPGEDVSVRIRYANEGTRALRNLKLRLPLDPRLVEVTASSAEHGGLENGALAWAPVTLSDLETVAPGAAGEVTARVRLLRRPSKYVKDAFLELAPEAVFGIEGTGIEAARAAGEGASLKVAGSAELAAVARYYSNEGDQIGRGPLPPRVGAATRYWVVMKVETGASDIRQGRVVLELPEGVEWTGKAAVTSGFQPTQEGRRLIWNIGDIPAHAGVVASPPNASFELALTPTASQIGEEAALLRDAVLTGTDAWTGRAISSSSGRLSTALPSDPHIDGRTTVRP